MEALDEAIKAAREAADRLDKAKEEYNAASHEEFDIYSKIPERVAYLTFTDNPIHDHRKYCEISEALEHALDNSVEYQEACARNQKAFRDYQSALQERGDAKIKAHSLLDQAIRETEN